MPSIEEYSSDDDTPIPSKTTTNSNTNTNTNPFGGGFSSEFQQLLDVNK